MTTPQADAAIAATTTLSATIRAAYVARQLLARRAVLATRRAWQGVDPDQIRMSWARGVGDQVLAITIGAQLQAADAADRTVTAMLVAQGLEPDAAAPIDPAGFAGVASDGRDLATLLELANVVALRQISAGQHTTQALTLAGRWLEMVVGTQVADATRMSTSVATTLRVHVSGWYRVLNPPSCDRCAVLAGKWYRWDAGFPRHPRCDCGQIAANDGALDDHPQLLAPQAYFDSLSRAEQDHTFTAGGAQAIRDGADISQVVNARSGMYTASVGGRDVLATTSGTTKRGYYSYVQREIDAQRQLQTTYVARDVGRRGSVAHYIERRVQRPRLMPEQIYRIAAGDRAEAWRLLAANGYIVGNIRDVASRVA